MKRKIFAVLFSLTLALVLTLFLASPAMAVCTLTPGASVDVDADTNGGAYTALNSISFTDLPGTDLANGNTFYLTAPAGFEFNPAAGTAQGAGYGTTNIDLGGGAGVAASPVYSGTDMIATWTVTAAGTGTAGTITISGMTIRPKAAKTSIIGDGVAYVTIAGTGGVSFSSANAHPINHVPGLNTTYTVVTQHGGTEIAGTSFSITLTARDQYGNVCDDGANAVNGNKAIVWTTTATASPNATPVTPIIDGNQNFVNGVVTSATNWTLVDPVKRPPLPPPPAA